MVVLGEDDDVVVGDEIIEDIHKMLPEDHLLVKYVAADHGFTYRKSDEITRMVLEFWKE